MLRRINDLPLMVVLTSSSALQVETPDARKFVDSAECIALTQLQLGPLPAHEAAELLDALMLHGANPGPTLRRSMLAGARGNPMVLELLVGDWRRRGGECLALSLGAMTTTASSPPEEAFRRVVDHTLVDLDAESRAVAELGAILGQRLNDLSMYTLVDLPVARTMRAMTSLAAQRILRDAGNTLEFTNEFVRGQCYIAMAAPLRRMLHGSVADRLLAQDGADEPIPGLEIAWHLVRADRLPEAVPYLLAGGREAIRRAAPHEADLALSTGLPALTGAGAQDGDSAAGGSAAGTGTVGRFVAAAGLGRGAVYGVGGSRARCIQDHRATVAGAAVERRNACGRRTSCFASPRTRRSDVEVRVKALAASLRILTVTRDEAQLEQTRTPCSGGRCVADGRISADYTSYSPEAWILSATVTMTRRLREVTTRRRHSPNAHHSQAQLSFDC